MKRALFQEPGENGTVRCGLCAHRCVIAPGRRGICAVRENRDGVLVSLVYDKVICQNIDPIEKKPLFHFLPGSLCFSIASPGCNFRCKHCQNADISQLPHDRGGTILGQPASADQIVAAARQMRCASISYTYTEPTILGFRGRHGGIPPFPRKMSEFFLLRDHILIFFPRLSRIKKDFPEKNKPAPQTLSPHRLAVEETSIFEPRGENFRPAQGFLRRGRKAQRPGPAHSPYPRRGLFP